jgi:hypothetical protein
VIAIVLGLVVCFFGYRLFRIVLAIYGLVLGAVLGLLVASLLGAGDTYVSLIAALVGGLIGAALMATLYKVGVFLVGAVAGAVLAGMIGANLSSGWRVVAIVLAALLLGIVAVLFQRIVLILATAFSGSWVVAQAGAALLAGRTMAWGDLLSNRFIPELSGAALGGFFATWLVLGIAGAVVQFRSKK